MNNQFQILSLILCFSCTAPFSEENRIETLLRTEITVNAILGSSNICSTSPESNSISKMWTPVTVKCPLGFKVPSDDYIFITYESLSEQDKASQKNFFIERISEESFRVRSDTILLAGKLSIQIRNILNREGILLDPIDFSLNFDSEPPTVSSSFPSGVYDQSIFSTNQFDLNFSEIVSGFDNLENYKIESTRQSILSIRNIAKLNETSVRLFWLGTFPKEGFNVSISLSGMSDIAGNQLQKTFSYQILGWSEGPLLVQARRDFGVISLSAGDFLVIGGAGPVSGALTTLSFVERFDSNLFKFVPENNLTAGRRTFSFVGTPEDRILISGGFTTTSAASITNSSNIYDPVRKTWSIGPNLSSARIGHTSCPISDNRILITGGRTSNIGSAVSTSEIVTLNGSGGGTIMNGPPMLVARMDHSCVTLPDGRVWIAGGSALETEFFTPSVSGGSFSRGPNLIQAQSGMVVLKDSINNIYMIGGFSASLTLDIVQKFEISSNRIIISGYMTKGRYNHAGAVLPDGNFLIQGGATSFSNSGLSDVEKIWKTGNLEAYILRNSKQAREGHEMITLKDGQILLFGGISGDGIPDFLNSTELFGYQ